MSYEVVLVRRAHCDRCGDRIVYAPMSIDIHGAVRAAGGDRVRSTRHPEQWEDRCRNCKGR